jgi:methylmalonyl-CoA mutase, C-terminal domain
MEKKIRVLVAKVGLDGHDRGAKVVAAHLRDQGMEVIYTGLRQTPEMVIESAIQEDVDVIGISILSGAHMNLFPDIIRLMKERELTDVLLVGGGIISNDDAKVLKDSGVGEIFGPGTSLGVISEYIKQWYNNKKANN